jgi:type I restriction enzyme S subunit
MSEKATTEKNKAEKVESLPEGWKRGKVRDLFILGRGRIISESYIRDHEGIYPVFSSQTENKGELGRVNTYDFEGEYITWTTDGANAGTVFYRSGKFNATNVCGIVKSKNDYVNVKFFSFLLSTIAKDYVSYIGNPKLMNNVFGSIIIKFPPLPEQRKIAEILETVDNAIEKTDAIIEKYRRIKKGLMADLLTGKIRLIPIDHAKAEGEESSPLSSAQTKKFVIGDKTFVAVPNQKWKNSPIGKIPADWEVVELGEVAHIVMGQSPNSVFINQEGRGIPFLQGNAEFTAKFPIPTNWIEKPLKVAKSRSILMSVRAPVGALNIADKLYCIGRGLSSISVIENYVKSKFLWYILHFSAKDLISLGQGSTFEAIGSNEIKSHTIPLPPLPEQQLIADVLSQVDEVIEKEIQYKEKLERIKKGLMEDLLTGKVRVDNLMEVE